MTRPHVTFSRRGSAIATRPKIVNPGSLRGGKVRRRVNERGRCNLRFATRTSGATNARTEGDAARDEEEHRVGRGVKRDLGDAGSVRPAGHAGAPPANVGGGSPTGCSPAADMNGARRSMPRLAIATASANHGG